MLFVQTPDPSAKTVNCLARFIVRVRKATRDLPVSAPAIENGTLSARISPIIGMSYTRSWANIVFEREREEMAVIPHSIDIVVADMAKSLAFYNSLGLAAPMEKANEAQVSIVTPGGATIGLIAETAMRQAVPDWITPVGQRVTFACRCDSAAELDVTYAHMIKAGYVGLKAPWDAFWGQRYAFLADPDGNRVDLFAAITDAGRE